MAWTAPMTAVANTAFTAAQFNTNVRDNLLETAPAKATAASRLIVTSGVNSVVERVPAVANVLTAQTTTSTAFTDLATSGPTVSVTTGSRAIWWIQGTGMNTVSVNAAVAASVDISGATTIASSDDRSIIVDGMPVGQALRNGICHLETGLNAGTNTFKMQYKTWTSGTASWANRSLVVVPL